MRDWQDGEFGRARQAFLAEFENWYAAYPKDVSAIEEGLNQKLAQTPNADAMEKKTWVYACIARSCDVHLFAHCPFYFEVVTGAPRNLVGSAFPPVPGLGSWVMRTDKTRVEERFDAWRKPCVDEGIVYSTLYVDLAHQAMGIGNVLKYGFCGLAERARAALHASQDARRNDFYKAAMIAAESVRVITEKFSRCAGEMLKEQTDPEVCARLRRIEQSSARCPWKPPETFFEALNTIWYLKELGNGLDSMGIAILGHLDRLLIPYYERDIARGAITPDEARDLIYWFISLVDAKWDLSEAVFGTNTSVTIGGCDQNGEPVFNDITRWVLQAMRDLHLINPKIQARFAKDAPDAYLCAVAVLAADGGNVLSVFNDEVMIPAQTRMGKALKDARLYVNGGCQETLLADTEVNSRGICYLNPVRYLEMMLFPESEPFFTRERIVPITLIGAQDFEEFYGRVLQNLARIVNALTWHYNEMEEWWPEHNPSPLFSLTLSDCLEKGLDASRGGTRYNNSSFALVGLGDYIDSLLAIRQTVFEEKRYTLGDMRAMLTNNFSGADYDRAWLRTKAQKYGQDDPDTNAFAARILNDLASVLSWMPNARGGLYEASAWPFYGYEWMKGGCGAAPDGKQAGESLSRGMNPPETTRSDIAAIVHSLTEMDLTRFAQPAVSYFTLPVMAEGDGAEFCRHLIRYFLSCGGSSADFDVLDPESLRDAMEHPDRHKNLVVRVCGYSVRFVDLDREMQEEIANRTRHIG